jgi:hypothetical protein
LGSSSSALDFRAPNLVVQVSPIGVFRLDEVQLPSARPTLHRLLAPNGRRHPLESLEPDQPLAVVSFGKAVEDALLVLTHALPQIAGYTDIERAVAAAGHDVGRDDGAITHASSVARLGPKDKPWDDDVF